MILNQKQTTVAYRCSQCGAGVLSVLGLFNITADMIKLKCDCGGSEMSLVYTKDSKVRFTVPCLFCPTPHNFTVNSTMFFEKDLFVIPCPYTDINICFLGNIDKVRTELDRTELELIDMLERHGIKFIASSWLVPKDKVKDIVDELIKPGRDPRKTF